MLHFEWTFICAAADTHATDPAGLWKCSWSVLVLVGAFYFVRSLVQFVTVINPNKPGTGNMYNRSPLGVNAGWVLSTMFFVDSVFVGIALQRMGDCCVRCGIKIRSALMTAVYTKTFRTAGVSDYNVVSLVATDCTKLYEGVAHVQNVWTAPLEATAIIALLLSLTEGIYGLPALGVLFFILPLQYYLGWRIAKYKLETVEVSDARVHRMHEVLLAVKLVKFYVWEKSFAKQVQDVSGHADKQYKVNGPCVLMLACIMRMPKSLQRFVVSIHTNP